MGLAARLLSPVRPPLSGYRSLRPLFEHLLDSFSDHLLIFIAVVAQGVLTNPPPHQRLGLSVVQIDDQCPFHILLWGDATHSSAEAAHAHCGIGCLLFHATACCEEQV